MIQLNSCQIITFLSSKFLEYNDRVVSEIVLDNGVRVMTTSRVDRVMNTSRVDRVMNTSWVEDCRRRLIRVQ